MQGRVQQHVPTGTHADDFHLNIRMGGMQGIPDMLSLPDSERTGAGTNSNKRHHGGIIILE
jgi:hypothetical protein